ncbi:hypothetical protein K9M74_03165 [Candidatus Woesearchaeota archaeon]|nr:hypothetical protein [Candidatus Woesearchaeota archaeon]
MEQFNPQDARPLGFDDKRFWKYMNRLRSLNDDISNFILLSKEQKKMYVGIPSAIAFNLRMPSNINIEDFAKQFSQPLTNKAKEIENLETKTEYVINKTIEIPLPKGVSKKNAFSSIITYQESYKPIIFEEKILGAVYDIELENQFPQIIPTEELFVKNELIQNFMQYIKEELYHLNNKNDPEVPVNDFYGPAYNEITNIRTVPEIIFNKWFITEHFVAKDYKQALKQYENRISSLIFAANPEELQENLK